MKLDKIDAQNQGEITNPTLILCEGKGDASFIFHLAEQRGLNGIQIGFPDPDTCRRYGKDGFGEFLTNVRARTGFKNLRRIVILRDRNDDSPDHAFTHVRDQIIQTGNYDVPSTLEQESSGVPSLTVRLIPDANTVGNLEVLLLSAANPAQKVVGCAEGFLQCLNLEGVSVGTTAKIKITAVVAGSCLDNPSCSLAWIWSSKRKWNQQLHPISLASPRFDDLVAFLRRFT